MLHYLAAINIVHSQLSALRAETLYALRHSTLAGAWHDLNIVHVIVNNVQIMRQPQWAAITGAPPQDQFTSDYE